MFLRDKKFLTVISLAACSALFFSACANNPLKRCTAAQIAAQKTTTKPESTTKPVTKPHKTGDELSDKKSHAKDAAIGAGIGILAAETVDEYMEEQEEELSEKLVDSGITVTRQGTEIVLNMPDAITFKKGSFEITPSFRKVLDAVVVVLHEHAQTIVTVAGFTDITGTAAFNQTLSQKRANEVSKYLQAKGIQKERLVSEGFGASRFIADNDTEEGRAKNRRVEIYLTAITEE